MTTNFALQSSSKGHETEINRRRIDNISLIYSISSIKKFRYCLNQQISLELLIYYFSN